MNWLAHLVLSESSPEFQVGNILADILPIGEVRALPAEFQAGVQRHRQIDKYTDSHAIVKRGIARLDPKFRRYGGVIVDVFYDHYLTTNWQRYSNIELLQFLDTFYSAVEHSRPSIPAGAYTILTRMRMGQWLSSYGDVEGVRITLGRISKRLKRPFDLSLAANELDVHYDHFGADFDAFFPELMASLTPTPSASGLTPASLRQM